MITYFSPPSNTVVVKKKREQAYKDLTQILISAHRERAEEGNAITAFFGSGLVSAHEIWHLSSESAYEILKRGVPSRSLAALSDYLGVGKGVVASLVDVDRTTAFRNASTDRPLPMHAAETVLRLLELTSLAEDTFETPEDAAQWLRSAHPMLNGQTPLELAKSGYGAERVKEILIALKYGGAV
ncbi:antitoxin Xre/MbcA/ParS toxin-binding domain-containing protein [Hydrogenophaga defluvii]|uniref:Antitoxin Xre/MbcA/ParS toxin-binding domain-containing protein n=1 Tax=Hydrogenophaga defluvii TaxID=249410 RepID=A0ABW2SFJ0_9BURK